MYWQCKTSILRMCFSIAKEHFWIRMPSKLICRAYQEMLSKNEMKEAVPFFKPGQAVSPLNSTGKFTFNIVPSSACTITKFNIFPVVSSLCTCTQRAYSSHTVHCIPDYIDICYSKHVFLQGSIRLKPHCISVSSSRSICSFTQQIKKETRWGGLMAVGPKSYLKVAREQEVSICKPTWDHLANII